MELDPNTLLTSGATALVQRMLVDGWDQARTRLAGFFARGRAEAGTGAEAEDTAVALVERELDESRAELLAAREVGDTTAEEDVRAAWRSRIRHALRDRPELAAELRTIVDELIQHDGTGQAGDTYHVVNKIEDGVYHGPVIMAGRIDSVHQETPPPGRPRDPRT